MTTKHQKKRHEPRNFDYKKKEEKQHYKHST